MPSETVLQVITVEIRVRRIDGAHDLLHLGRGDAELAALPLAFLLAMSLGWMFANYLLKALCGALCLRKVQSSLFKGEE